MTTEHTTPRWILFYVGFLALLSLSTSLMGYLAPQLIFSDLDIPFDAARPITFFYANRNVGIFVLCIFGLLTRDAKVILSMLLLRFVVELLDLACTVYFGIGGFNPIVVSIVWFAVFLIPEFMGIYALYRQEFGRQVSQPKHTA